MNSGGLTKAHGLRILPYTSVPVVYERVVYDSVVAVGVLSEVPITVGVPDAVPCVLRVAS